MTATTSNTSLRLLVEPFMESAPGWTLRQEGFWCHATDGKRFGIVQGWKLHVAATPTSAPAVLRAAVPVLLRHGCRFKFAADLSRVEELTSARYDRAQAGKFITTYPRDEDTFHAVARELCEATEGLEGPRILSDRQYRPGSIVQYRYGAFTGVPYLNNDGVFENRIIDSAGHPVKDARNPWYSVPPWVPPLQVQVERPAVTATARPARPLLADGRFEVTAAIRHSARGGVYRATDLRTRREVLLKEARPHIGSGATRRDSRTLLAHEAEVLTALSGLTPSLIESFREGDHEFIAEEFVVGHTLAQLIRDRPRSDDELTRIALDLTSLVASVHGRGWVIRDLTSNNVMMTAAGRLVLIDVEHASRVGAETARAYTPGFGAPEVVNGARYPQHADQRADLFALGAILIHLVLGEPPCLLADEGISTPISERIEQLLSSAASDFALIRQWYPLLRGLTAEEPATRWPVAQAAEFLRRRGPATVTYPPEERAQILERIIEVGVEHLAASIRPDKDWLWQTEGFGSTTDPLNIQYGAAGGAAVLLRAARNGNSSAQAVLPAVTDWIRTRIATAPRLLPGLYFGRAGAAWALGELAQFLDDEQAWHAAAQVALELPVAWPNPDVCHGVAGSGFTMLRFWRLSGDERFAERARSCADHLRDTVEVHAEEGVFWPIPKDFDSALAGACHLGFGHGVAGIGAFLLATGRSLNDQRYLAVASEAGRTLARAADIDSYSGAATWRTERHPSADAAADMRYHWCSGSSGVGTFLARLLAAGIDPDYEQTYRELVHAAAVAVHAARWRSPTAACHGLAGNGQFLLDLAAMAEGPHALTYRRWAGDLAGVIASRRATSDGRFVLPDESGLKETPGYGTGSAGILDFIMRLVSGGERLWTEAVDVSADASARHCP